MALIFKYVNIYICMEQLVMKQKFVNLRTDQIHFLEDQRGTFNFGKFVRGKLDEYIEFKRRLEE